MCFESDLRKEIGKWTKRIGKEIKKVKPRDHDKENEHLLEKIENINAYIKDSRYFLEKGDLIRSFEAIVWAWAWLQILKELGVFK
ncbi:MAG: DUF357 domain-containing protein [Candidatus Aenigmarchaeota archaeon]